MTLNLHLLWPEFLVAGAVLAVILTDLTLPPERRARPTALAASLGLLAALLWIVFGRDTGLAMSVADAKNAGELITSWRSDGFSLFVRGLAAGGGLLVVLLSIPWTKRLDRGHGEFYALLLIAVLGVMLVSGVQDLLSLFVCLELVTINSYILAAFKRNDARSTEAGLKYLLVGAVSTAILVLGIAFTYGATGGVSFDRLGEAVSAGHAPTPLLAAGLVLVLAGLLFKVGGVPFHVWIPDVYQGAPTPVTAFLSTGSKAAGVVLLLRMAQTVFVPSATNPEGLPWAAILGVIAAATLLFGTLGAVPQRSIKRMLGYSSIAHAGYLLLGVTAAAASGTALQDAGAAILFYLLAFVLTNLTAFAVVVLVGAATGRHEAPSYAGLAKRSPLLGLAMLLALLSLAGVPPLSGFFGKFLILKSVVTVATAEGSPWLFALAFLGAAGVVVSLYFYMSWIARMYFPPADAPVETAPIRVGPWAGTVLAVGIAAMLAMGIVMGPFFDWARDAAASLVAAR